MFVLMYLQKRYLSLDMGKSFIVRSYLLVPTGKPQLQRIKKNYRYYFMKKMKTSLIFEFFHLRCQNHLTLTLYILYKNLPFLFFSHREILLQYYTDITAVYFPIFLILIIKISSRLYMYFDNLLHKKIVNHKL